uniref:Uncharacterized protein n=1 Tax=Romanomermis culicivorax TaxID=13658 RepID=A0A915JHB7_ROMCU
MHGKRAATAWGGASSSSGWQTTGVPNKNKLNSKITVSNGVILKNSIDGHHGDCQYRSFGSVNGTQLDQRSMSKHAKSQKRPLE